MKGLTKHLLNGIKVPFVLLFAWMTALGIKGIFTDGGDLGSDIAMISMGIIFVLFLGLSFLSKRKNIIIENTPFDHELGEKVEVQVNGEWLPATVEFVAGKGIRDEKYDWALAEDWKGIMIAWDDAEAAVERITKLVKKDISEQEGARLEVLVLQVNDPRVLRRR